ncbi:MULTISPECIES: DUF4365 domain-containing protein [unclassified Streptomyces]|uniref:DUF4365 domain-containing protein n=1 Tax=unclassified Streptomyces TaxID=2593676 RepID=UPI003439F3B5
MRVRQTHGIERAGVSWIEHLVTTKLGWLFRSQDIADFGIDVQLEVVDGSPAEATGRLLGVQVKSGASHFRVPTEAGWWFLCDADHVSYWLGHSLPVLVMLYEPATKQVYWQHVSDRTVVSTGKGAKIHVPKVQELTAESAQSLSPLARSQEDVPAVGEWVISDIDQRKQEVFNELLLSARLHAMFPDCGILRRWWDEPCNMTVALAPSAGLRLRSVVVDVAIVTSALRAAFLISTYGRRRFAPLVIVVMDTRQPDGLPSNPSTLPVFVTRWSPDGKNDASLKSAFDNALSWATDADREQVDPWPGIMDR